MLALRRADSRLVLPLVALAYFAVAKLGLSYAEGHEIVSAVWPPSGVAVAAVVLFGSRIWPSIFAGALVANATGDATVAVAAGIATGNALATLTAGELLERAGFDAGLRRVRDVIALGVLAGGLATGVNAVIGTASLWLGSVVEPEGLVAAWRTWWLGDMTGVLLVAPAVLVAARGLRLPRRPPQRDRFAEGSLIALVLVAGTLIVLRDSITLAAPIFPVIILSALRFRQAGAVFSSLIAAAIIVVYTASGDGPFAGGDPETDLLRAQLFVVIGALTGLLIASMRTEWERAEEALARVEEGERALAEAQALAHVGSWEWDVATDTSTWSDEMFRIAGLEPGSVALGYNAYLNAVHPEDREKVATIVGAALAEGEMADFRHRVVQPDGSVRIADCRGRAVTDAAGRVIKLTGTMQDVTDQQLAQERFRGLLETAPDAMVIVDEDGRIAFAISQTERLFGYTAGELTGRPVETLVPVRARAGHPGHRSSFLKDPHARPMGGDLDLTALRKDGTEFPVEISLSPLRTDEGILVSSAIRD
ncbi:MAG TPA: MASE1 domain-containing protein, partial [Casimicrobiaceae bacterium]